MKISFDREEYLSIASIFESGQLDDVTNELSEFNDDPEDMAYELAYTRYELAKAEARHNALVEAVKKEIVARGCYGFLRNSETAYYSEVDAACNKLDAARAEVDRLIANESTADCEAGGCAE